jgi:hypothetical protein
MSKKNIPMDILSMVIYVWIFCLIILISIALHVVINFIIDITFIFVPLRKYVFGYGSPIFVWFNIIYDYIIRTPISIIIISILFFSISIGIIILFLIWIALKDMFIIGLLVRGPPFSTLKGIFNIILEKIPSKKRTRFVNYIQKHSNNLVKYLKIDEINLSLNETFAVQNITEEPHFGDEYSDEIGDEYKMKIKNNYFINAFKYNKQNEMAKNYKNMKIITPDSNYVFIENTTSYFSVKAETNINKMNIK